MISAADIAERLRGWRLPMRDEKATQARIAELLADLDARREVRLSDGDIIDLMVGGVGVEVKLRGSRVEILRQLERYAGHAAVRELLLVTGTAMRLPPAIGGKPVRGLSLGAAWL